MKISDYIRELEKIKAEVGDVEVEQYDTNFDRKAARIPIIAYREILDGKKTKPRFWNEYDDEKRKGVVVCRI